jgi:hypothetical protein
MILKKYGNSNSKPYLLDWTATVFTVAFNVGESVPNIFIYGFFILQPVQLMDKVNIRSIGKVFV